MLPTQIVADVEQASATAIQLPVGGSGWRYEVTANGRYWQWRRGSGHQRQSVYGGVISTLPAERRNQYEHNRTTKARTKTR